MEGEANSWIGRTKFSRTVCYRLDSSRLASLPLAIQQKESIVLDSKSNTRCRTSFLDLKQESFAVKIQQTHGIEKQRAVSPLPETKLSNIFKEAKLLKKRSSTPQPRRNESEKGIVEKLLHLKGSNDHKAHGFFSPGSHSPFNMSPLRHLASNKTNEKTKRRKETAWVKYFDHAGGRVSSVEAADECTVDLSKLFIGLRFAHGAHSQLYHGMYEDEPVAVKVIKVPDDDENRELSARLEKQFNREVNLLSRLDHSNVIKFVAACKKPPVFCIITEYLSEGSLRSFLHKLEQEPVEQKFLPLPKLLKMALDIAKGMEFIHSQGIIHRDLKPENILICEDFHLKVADFGIACEHQYCDLVADDPGTYRWMAPEMIKRKAYGRKVDVYGFGLILWELVAGTIPYKDMTPIQAAFAVVNKNLRPAIPDHCPPAMKALIEQCWCLQPEKRPEFWQIVKVLEWFESSLTSDGTMASNMQDHKELPRWIDKLAPMHTKASSARKPKFR